MPKHYDGIKEQRPLFVLNDHNEELDWANHVEPKIITLLKLKAVSCTNAWNTNFVKYEFVMNNYKINHGRYPGTMSMRDTLYKNRLGVEVKDNNGNSLSKKAIASRLKEVATREIGSKVIAVLSSDVEGKTFGDFALDLNVAYTDNAFSQLILHEEFKYNGVIHCNLIELRVNILGEWVRLFTVLPIVFKNRASEVKVCKPIIRLNKNGLVVLDYKIEYDVPKYRKEKEAEVRAGLDLGFVEPYVLVVTTLEGRVVARYHASSELKRLQHKINVLYNQVGKLQAKFSCKKVIWFKYGIPESQQREWSRGLFNDIQRKKEKINTLKRALEERMASDVYDHLHSLNVDVTFLNMEELSWLAGKPGRPAICKTAWAYGRMFDAISHALGRDGVWCRKVRAGGTSQECNDCGCQVTHRGRTVYCDDGCLTSHGWDRDLNAAVNISMRR